MNGRGRRSVRDLDLRGRRAFAMPRQRTHYSRRTYVIPDDFQERLRRFKEESDLSWSEISRRLGTYRHTVWRWCKAGVRPQPTSHESASGPGRRLWPRLHIHRVGNGAPAKGWSLRPRNAKGPHTWLRAWEGSRTWSDDLPRTSRSSLTPTGSLSRKTTPID